ncbi:HAD-IIB family hydrolase [Priestia taiwanensis]|uniref:Kanosamine-6-phosphate phosphatase n=1 Tax=Priestia taiwanensis TaxID=1347902 RepID=A0A917ENP0_9BACI|nr:HAD-IIB family hydrolase [Priestia taiwanensis]MBM7362614.1 kanosamine-6-phosphate phosphatase [Priestia taiwanensis]GGE63676.1 kanosamine-6-phosphate phosphatase [Priestia taiwanensis]
MIMKNRKPFHYTSKTDFLLLFDFDETYYPHNQTVGNRERVYKLEEYLQTLATQQNVKIGWITGSSVGKIIEKMNLANMTYYPHFIGSDLGTELIEINEEGEFTSISKWERKINRSSFSSRVVDDLLQECKNQYNVKLVAQTQFGQSNNKYNYYYFHESTTKTAYDLRIIRHVAKLNGVGVNISCCNPMAGDPKDAYDVDFIPLGSGKKTLAMFMMEYYDVPVTHTIAFGDSGNDIEMLKAVNHGYLVGNATEEAKRLHNNLATAPYGGGIIEVCKKIFVSNDLSK